MTMKNKMNSTSLEAYHNEVKPNLNKKQQLVLRAISVARRPVCNQEIADYLKKPINTITPRVNELVKSGAVTVAFKAPYPVTKRKVTYWRIVDDKARLLGV